LLGFKGRAVVPGLNTTHRNADSEGMDQQNRRRAIRVNVVAIASLEVCGQINPNDQALCTVRNLSRTGIGLETGQPPLKGQIVMLRLVLEDQLIEINARATRVMRKPNSYFYEVGLDWSSCTAEELQFLDRVLGVLVDEPLPNP
jgi:c-di-GMP-binding flagellar brake protein YcgR